MDLRARCAPNSTVVEVDKDDVSYRRTTPDWLDQDTALKYPASWPEATDAVPLVG